MKTKYLLDIMKRDLGVKTYAEVISWLAKKGKRLEKSELGTLPKLEEFKRDKRDRFD